MTAVIEAFKSHYFSFLMGGTAEEFRAAAKSLDTALCQGATLADAQKSMDDARNEAELLSILFGNPSLHGLG